ncbi:hypothetical protein F4809DRAFT_643673 [Biscogniauxia mediterranea]|nr:hypothetical protein F4809DRAFT_643673 [Biscogniauxia mediterranea]
MLSSFRSNKPRPPSSVRGRYFKFQTPLHLTQRIVLRAQSTQKPKRSDQYKPFNHRNMSIPATLVPDDWTTDPQEMRKDYYWGTNGSGRLVAASVGITEPEALMIKSREAGGDGYVFQDSKGIYLWSMPTNDVYKYTKPTDRDAILAEMSKPAGRGRVEMELLDRISEIDE